MIKIKRYKDEKANWMSLKTIPWMELLRCILEDRYWSNSVELHQLESLVE